jgi:hypothetical protein
MAESNQGIRIAFLAAVAVFALVTAVTFFAIGGGAEDEDPTPDDGAGPVEGRGEQAEAIRDQDVAYAATDAEGGLGLEMIDFQLDPGSSVVEGSVQNTANDPYVNVQVAFRLTDAQGNTAGIVRDTTSQINPGHTWVFRIPTTATATTAELDDLSGGRLNATPRLDDPRVTPAQDGYQRSADPTPNTTPPGGSNQ